MNIDILKALPASCSQSGRSLEGTNLSAAPIRDLYTRDAIFVGTGWKFRIEMGIGRVLRTRH